MGFKILHKPFDLKAKTWNLVIKSVKKQNVKIYQMSKLKIGIMILQIKSFNGQATVAFASITNV